MIKRNSEVEILVNGRPLKEYSFNHKIFIEGRKDSVFSIRLRNNSSERVLFVPTVDGLSVMDGKDGSFDSRGYIVDAFNSITIDGWRLSNNEVAEFYFSSPEDSYRKRKGMGNNLGSIAIAVFREKEKKTYIHWPSITYPIDDLPKPQKPWKEPNVGSQYTFESGSIELSSMNQSNCFYATSATSARAAQDLGTGFGETKRSEVTSVSFDREYQPDVVLEMFYNSRKQLEKIGIDFDRQSLYISETNSFPNEKGFCERPSR